MNGRRVVDGDANMELAADVLARRDASGAPPTGQRATRPRGRSRGLPCDEGFRAAASATWVPTSHRGARCTSSGERRRRRPAARNNWSGQSRRHPIVWDGEAAVTSIWVLRWCTTFVIEVGRSGWLFHHGVPQGILLIQQAGLVRRACCRRAPGLVAHSDELERPRGGVPARPSRGIDVRRPACHDSPFLGGFSENHSP